MGLLLVILHMLLFSMSNTVQTQRRLIHERFTFTLFVLALIVLLAVSVGWAQARSKARTRLVSLKVGRATAAILEDAIPIQGRLTDASGVSLSGDHSVTFSLYDDPEAGTLCARRITTPLPMTNGLFNVTVTGCDDSEIDGDQLFGYSGGRRYGDHPPPAHLCRALCPQLASWCRHTGRFSCQ